jgi:hypothetical protein
VATRTPKPSRSSAGSSTDGPPAKKRKTDDQNDARNHGNRASPNHSGGATNPNTPVFPYLSKAQKRGSCDKEQDAIKKHCNEKTGKQKSAQAPDKLSNTKSLGAFAEKVKGAVVKLDDGAKKLYGYNAETQNNANQWVGEHCSGLWVKPGGGLDPTNISRFKDQLEAIKQDYLNDASGLAQKMGWSIVQKVEDRAAAYGQQVLEEEGAAAVSLLVPGVGEVVEAGTQVWVALTGVWNAVSTAYSVAKFAVTEGPKILAQVKDLIGQADNIKKLLSSDTSMFDVMADMMAGIAELNPCVKARKCSLVPYKDTKTAPEQAKSGKGCCPGQTGHHLMPDTMFRDPDAVNTGKSRGSKKTLKCWENYDVDKAPVICLEGTMNHATNGSHGAAHELTEQILEKQRKIGPDGKMKPISYNTARDELSKMVEAAYGCSKKCIAAQLDAYYKDAYTCGGKDPTKDGTVMPNSGASSPGDKAAGAKPKTK